MVSTTLPTFTNPYFIGWDRVFDRLSNISNSGTFPPYNLIQLEDEDNYLLELALAGYSEKDIEIQVEDGNLIIKGNKEEDEKERKYLHKGIAGRKFTNTFSLAEHMEVIGAELVDGILYIAIKRNIPEAKKPRVISINSGIKKKLTR